MIPIPPPVERPDPPDSGDERTLLDAWLDFHRATLLHKCSGLGEDQLRQRSVPPSSLSLLGLVRHLTEVERGWFRRGVLGEEVEPIHYSEADPDGDFDNVDDADVEADIALYRETVVGIRADIAGRDLDETFTRRDRTISLRWVYGHMIEEYARHNGHADLLRERIDGVTGE